MKKIGILTSGGDCGGLNGVVKGAAQTANSLGITPYVIPNGYAGLYNLIDFDKLTALTPERAWNHCRALQPAISMRAVSSLGKGRAPPCQNVRQRRKTARCLFFRTRLRSHPKIFRNPKRRHQHAFKSFVYKLPRPSFA